MRLVDVPWLRNFTNAEAIAYAMMATPGARLTLTQGTPITDADVTGATSIYAEPMEDGGAIMPLWKDVDGTRPRIMLLQPSTLALALGTLASAVIPNDTFYFDAGVGSVGLEKLVWTNATTRATALVRRNGRYYKSGDYSRLWAGTFYPTSTTTTEDSYGGAHQAGGKRFLWNMYNRVPRGLAVIDTTDNWAYKTATTRQVQGAPGNMVEFVLGLADQVEAQSLTGYFENGSVGAVLSGLGLDTTTAISGFSVVTGINIGANSWKACVGRYSGRPAEGYHYISWNENGGGVTGTGLWLGDNGSSGQSGVQAEIRA